MFYLCVLDFEATCWEKMEGRHHEIIEFPSILWCYKNKSFVRIGDFQEYVRPRKNQILSDFCRDLTGITQEQVNQGDSLEKVLSRHKKWIYSTIDHGQVIIVTVGDWDLNNCLAGENMKIPSIYKRWIDIKDEFKKFYHYKRGLGLSGMLNYLQLEFEGRPHCGFDDCHNTSRILERMIKDGYDPTTATIHSI